MRLVLDGKVVERTGAHMVSESRASSCGRPALAQADGGGGSGSGRGGEDSCPGGCDLRLRGENRTRAASAHCSEYRLPRPLLAILACEQRCSGNKRRPAPPAAGQAWVSNG
jgi:hypothetical protein